MCEILKKSVSMSSCSPGMSPVMGIHVIGLQSVWEVLFSLNVYVWHYGLLVTSAPRMGMYGGLLPFLCTTWCSLWWWTSPYPPAYSVLFCAYMYTFVFYVPRLLSQFCRTSWLSCTPILTSILSNDHFL
jgi:hypothetical protein